jgi:hypothetical protein
MTQITASPNVGDLGQRAVVSILFLVMGFVGVWSSRKAYLDPMAKPKRFLSTRWVSNTRKGRRIQCVYGIFASIFFILSCPLWLLFYNRPLVQWLAVAAAIIAGVVTKFLIPQIPANAKRHPQPMKQ